MCLYPRLIKNRKYSPNKKNNYKPPFLYDKRLEKVAVGCGNCIECRKQKAREWQVRLNEEIQYSSEKPYFVTMTFSDDSLAKISKHIETTENNAIAKFGVRKFLERWRKKYTKSVKHWLITELGGENDRIHLHGIIFHNDLTNEELQKIWSYGWTYIGEYCNTRTINYIIKYCTKIDEVHKNYLPVILCSSGLGKGYIERNKFWHSYERKNTKDYYVLPNGNKIALPIYYRNKLFSEKEREKLWIEKVEEKRIFVCGIECDISNDAGYEHYMRVLEEQQKINTKMGYGDNSEEWQKKDYKIALKKINANLKSQKYKNLPKKFYFTYHKLGNNKKKKYLCINFSNLEREKHT